MYVLLVQTRTENTYIQIIYAVGTNARVRTVEKKMSDRRPMYTFCGAVGFSFGLGVARAGPYQRRHVGRWTRAFRL